MQDKRMIKAEYIKYSSAEITKYTMLRSDACIYKFSKSSDLNLFKDIKSFFGSYVYILVGTPPFCDNCYTYIGQANTRTQNKTVLHRIQEHYDDSTIWNEAFIIVSEQNSFGATELNYLENAFYTFAKKSNRYIVMNGVVPFVGNVAEDTQWILQGFAEDALCMLAACGCNVFGSYLSKPLGYKKEEHFEKLANGTTKKESSDSSYISGETLICIGKDGTRAEGITEGKKIIVQKGSTVSKVIHDSIKNHNYNSYIERIWLEDNGIICNGEFVQDYTFSSYTAAACVILGRAASPSFWKSSEEEFNARTSFLNQNDGEYIYCQHKEINAIAKIHNAQVEVLKGSSVSSEILGLNLASPDQIQYVEKRKSLEQQGVIKNGKFVENYCFSSMSVAASVIYGKKVNGQQKWKKQCKVGFADLARDLK